MHRRPPPREVCPCFEQMDHVVCSKANGVAVEGHSLWRKHLRPYYRRCTLSRPSRNIEHCSVVSYYPIVTTMVMYEVIHVRRGIDARVGTTLATLYTTYCTIVFSWGLSGVAMFQMTQNTRMFDNHVQCSTHPFVTPMVLARTLSKLDLNQRHSG